MSFDKEGGWPDRSEIARTVLNPKDATELYLYASVAMSMACAVSRPTMQESIDMFRLVSRDTELMLRVNWDKFRMMSKLPLV